MKKRDERRFQAIVREVFIDYLYDVHSRGVNIGWPTWAEVHPGWKHIFYDQARAKLREELLRVKR